MKCRFCEQTELVQGKYEEFETLSDHVSDPNALRRPLRETFVCADDKCLANTVANGFWDAYGDFYYKNWDTEELKPYRGYSGDYPAYDSHASSTDTEIYKNNENFTFYKGLKWRLGIEFKYKADNNGKVLKRTPKLAIGRKDFNSFKHMIEYITHFGKAEDYVGEISHLTNLRMLRHCLKDYFRAYGKYQEVLVDISEYPFSDKLPTMTQLIERKDNYLFQVKKKTQESGQYKSWRRQSKPLDMLHGSWEWYRPLANFIIERHYEKHIGEKQIG
jgi:hypothetical protein